MVGGTHHTIIDNLNMRMLMKYMFQIWCILISLLVTTDSMAGSYNVRGEVSYSAGKLGSQWSRTIMSNVVSGLPITLKQSGTKVSMLFDIEPPPSKKYTVTISLLTEPKQADEISVTLFTRTYEARLVGGASGPFEFEEIQGDTKFGGALALSLRQ